MNHAQARDLVIAQCAAAVDPVLTVEEVNTLLDATARYCVWQPSTTYQHGVVVIPTVRNGHTYRAIVNQQYSASPAGVSAATEPIWPLFTNPDGRVGVTRPYWGGYDGLTGNYAVAMVTDGTVVWQEAGPDSAEQYDVQLATYNAWLAKAGKASGRITSTFGPDKTWANQVVDHCLAMALKYAPTSIF